MKKQSFVFVLMVTICSVLIGFSAINAQAPAAGGTIQFGPGETSAWRSGYVSANTSVRYFIYAMSGQNLIVSLGSETGTAVLGIRDNQGRVYLDPGTGCTYWNMVLPETGTYVIDVYGSLTGADAGTAFAFQVVIPPLGQPQTPWIPPVPVDPQPQVNGGTIQFGYGQTSAVISGKVPANGRVRYDLYAMAGQHFIVMLRSASGTAVLGISDNLGNSYLSSSSGYTYWSMVLPKTNTYYIDIAGQNVETDFVFQVIIPARITIPQTSYSVTYNAGVAANGVVSFMAYAAAGQVMAVRLNSGATPNAFLRISGIGSGVVYLDNNAYQTNWSASLPATQDYLIEVVGTANPANYQLTVDIR